MAINRVDFMNSTLIDLSEDTVVPEKLIKDYTAHQADGAKITGTFDIQPELDAAVNNAMTEIYNSSY